jgi:hypothetical protein
MIMKMSIEDFLSSTFKIDFCVDEHTRHVAVIEPEWEDDWVTVSVGEYYYDVNLWLDDDDVVRFAVYRLKSDPDNSPDFLTMIDSKVVCSDGCSSAVITVAV